MAHYTIGEFSKLTGISVTALRYYDKIGLINPDRVKDSGYRLYSGRQLLHAQFINNMKSIGLSLDDILQLEKNGVQGEIMDKISSIKRQMEQSLRVITNLQNYYSTGLSLRDHAGQISELEEGILSGCYYLEDAFTNADLEDIFTYHCQEIQNRRDEKGLHQLTGMRMIFDAGSPDSGRLIMPVEEPDDPSDADGYMEPVRTMNAVILKKSIDFTGETKKMMKLIESQGRTPSGDPVIECLLDPGDMVDQDSIMVRIHVPVAE